MARHDSATGMSTSTWGWRAKLQEWQETGQLNALSPLGVLILLIAVMSIGNPNFLAVSNLVNILEQIVTLLILALGQTFVILLGGIDLSVAAICSLTTLVVAMLVPVIGYGAFPAGIALGAAAGWITGTVHARARIPSFIASLGAMGTWTGIAFTMSDATPITILQRDQHFVTWVTERIAGLPNAIVIGFVLVSLTFFLERYTRFGRSVKAIGAGEQAAALSGVDVVHYKALTFVLSGALAGLSGVVLVARMSGGSGNIADAFLLKSIAIVILGGTSISGGVGGVLRTLIGVLFIMVLDTGMNVVGVDVYAQQAVYGVVIILAVALTIDRRRMPIIK